MKTEELVLPYLDDVSGTLRGYRIFTACRTVGDAIFRLEDHLDRLYRSAASIYMTPPLPRERLKELVVGVVMENRQNGFTGDLLLDIIFSGGLEGATMKKAESGAHLYVTAQGLVRPPKESYEKGVSLATFPYQRIHPAVKLLNYVGAILAHQTVVPRLEAFDVLFVCPTDGQTVLEGSTFTVFFVDTQGAISTPPLDGKILDSVTRRVVIELLKPRTDMTLREIPLRLDEVLSYPEAFLVSTTRNVLPVTRINDTVIGNGLPGPITRSVAGFFEDYLSSYDRRAARRQA